MAGRAAARRFDRRHRHARIDGDEAVLVGQHRVEIELAHLRQIGSQLRELDQQERDGVGICGRNVAVGLEHARHPGARDQLAGKLEIERRQRQRLVADDLDRGPAAAEHDDRAEGRIVGDPRDQFARFRTQNHRMDRHAGDASIRPHCVRSREDIGDRLAHRAFAGEVEPHATDLGLVHDVRRQNFRHDARSVRQQWAPPRRRLHRHRAQAARARSEWDRLRAAA